MNTLHGRTLQTLRRGLAFCSRRVDREDEQHLGRLLICIASVGMYAAVPAPAAIALFIGTVCIGVAAISLVFLILASRSKPDHPEPGRRFAMMLVDLLAITLMLSVGQRYAAPFWGFFLWISLDFGFRYGANYLRLAVPLGAIGFTIPLFVGGSFWMESIWLWVSMQLTLVIVPLAVLHQAKLNERANDALRASSRQKTRLLGHLTSTLQTPLGGILRAAEAIQHAPNRSGKLVDVIAVSARHLIILTQDMLDRAAIEAGQLTRQECAFDIREVGNEAVAALLAAAEAKNVIFKVATAPAVPDLVYADLAHVRQILVYCLDRVLTAAAGEVRVDITTHIGTRGQGLRFEVTAPGVNEFVERAYLSVTMAPALIEFLGGETGQVDDKIGEVGVWVTLPCTFVESPVIDEPPSEAENVLVFTDIFARHRRMVPKMRVLVIEDQSSDRFLLGNILSRAGHTATPTATGEEGLEAMDQAASEGRPFDAVLLDLHLPDQPGANVIRMINFLQVGARTPLIVITADRSDAALASCRDAGVAAFLSKPVKASQLLDAVALAASLRPGGQSSLPPQPQQAAEDVRQFELQQSEDAMAREFVRRCLLDAETAVSRLENAAIVMNWPEAAEHAYSVYAVACNTADQTLIAAAGVLHEMPTPAFKIYWQEHVANIRAAIGWLRETNTRQGR